MLYESYHKDHLFSHIQEYQDAIEAGISPSKAHPSLFLKLYINLSYGEAEQAQSSDPGSGA